MLKIKNESEEDIIRNEEKELEGEFYYMSTRYKSLIPLINEVKAQRGEIQFIKSKLADVQDKLDKILKFFDAQKEKVEKNKKKK